MEDECVAEEAIWQQVVSRLPTTSCLLSDELKTAVGDALVEETIDLQKEVSQLHGIYIDIFRERHCCEDYAKSRLEESCQIRANVYKEISLFLNVLSEQNTLSKREVMKIGGTPDAVIEDVLIHVAEIQVGSGKMETNANKCPKDNGNNEKLAEIFKQFEHLSISNGESFESISSQLRELLIKERQSLLTDVCDLQNNILNVNRLSTKKPSIQELRRTSASLEQEILRLRANQVCKLDLHSDNLGTIPSQPEKKRSCSSAPQRLIPSPPSGKPTCQARWSSVARNVRVLNTRTLSLPSMKDTHALDPRCPVISLEDSTNSAPRVDRLNQRRVLPNIGDAESV